MLCSCFIFDGIGGLFIVEWVFVGVCDVIVYGVSGGGVIGYYGV